MEIEVKMERAAFPPLLRHATQAKEEATSAPPIYSWFMWVLYRDRMEIFSRERVKAYV